MRHPLQESGAPARPALPDLPGGAQLAAATRQDPARGRIPAGYNSERGGQARRAETVR
ncbi:hypothetical protein [Streptomyces albidoflavus]|uniref:hypothetical protein n=1 Tax=Streptomyces albidoflavus TaxID=1886 RepID=UPI0015CCB6E9|nr:hypothetical protein [Streptomyces albidoflavus]